jgi:hypothetical protein
MRDVPGKLTCPSTITICLWYILLTYGAAERGHAPESAEYYDTKPNEYPQLDRLVEGV